MISELVPGETCYIVWDNGLSPVVVLGFATTLKDVTNPCPYCLRIRREDGGQGVAVPCVVFSAEEALASRLSGILPSKARGKCSTCEGVI